ncbi:MAG: hypothetical protein Q8R00_03005 [Candidatus Nanoarchaeia archaeon]|nr:hypothetical protein [Candidatus Nanoarchaeia archaeon]
MKQKEALFIAGIILLVSLIAPVNTGFVIADLEKPQVNYDSNKFPIITEEHITYVLYALDAESLKKIIFTSNYPQMEILTARTKTYYTIYVVDNEIQTYKGQATDPDGQIRLSEESIATIINSEDPKAKAKELANQGLIGYTLYSGYTELFLKGYWSLYDTLKA